MAFFRFLSWTALPALVPVVVAAILTVVLVGFDVDGDLGGWVVFLLLLFGPVLGGLWGSTRYSVGKTTGNRVLLGLGGFGVGVLVMWISIFALVAIAFSGMEFAAVG